MRGDYGLSHRVEEGGCSGTEAYVVVVATGCLGDTYTGCGRTAAGCVLGSYGSWRSEGPVRTTKSCWRSRGFKVLEDCRVRTGGKSVNDIRSINIGQLRVADLLSRHRPHFCLHSACFQISN